MTDIESLHLREAIGQSFRGRRRERSDGEKDLDRGDEIARHQRRVGAVKTTRSDDVDGRNEENAEGARVNRLLTLLNQLLCR